MDDKAIKQMQEQNETFRTKLAGRDAEIQRLNGEAMKAEKFACESARAREDVLEKLTTQNAELATQLKAAKADFVNVFTKISNSVVEMIHKHQGG